MRKRQDTPSLIIDRTTPIQQPSEQQHSRWARDKRVFVSSTMEDLAGERNAVAETISKYGAQPVMFEAFGARSEDSRQAYTAEVRRSDIYLGILSRRYGTKLPSGYSATHEEYEEARKHRKEILLFLDESVPQSERDGHLNRWIQELYDFHVVSKFDGIADLMEKVQTSLDKVAGEQLTPWVKLDRAVFQATRIEKSVQQRTTTVTVSTASQDPRVKSALSRLVQKPLGSDALQLTFRRQSLPVQVVSLDEVIDPMDRDSLVLTCESAERQLQYRSPHPLLRFPGGISTPSRRYEYSDLIEIALRSIALSEEPPRDPMLASAPTIDFDGVHRQCEGDAQIFPKVVQLLIVEAVHEHGIADEVLDVAVGRLRRGEARVRISVGMQPPYSGGRREVVEVKGSITLEQ